MWGTGTGDDARIYDYLGEDGNNPLLAAGVDTTGVSTFDLIDARDNNTYSIRRLADGYCWMTVDLDLDLATFAFTNNLTPDNTDLDSNKRSYWDPAESSYNAALEIASSEDYSGPSVTQSNYFSILSEDWLGVAQQNQFLSVSEAGTVYRWLSTRNNSGNTISSAADCDASYSCSQNSEGTWLEDSIYASIPRTYRSRYRRFYNFYAATAETELNANKTMAEESICPYAWTIPTKNSNEYGLQKLLNNIYMVNNSGEISKLPLVYPTGGTYNPNEGAVVYEASDSVYSLSDYNYSAHTHSTLYFNGAHIYWFSTAWAGGQRIRCVARE